MGLIVNQTLEINEADDSEFILKENYLLAFFDGQYADNMVLMKLETEAEVTDTQKIDSSQVDEDDLDILRQDFTIKKEG